MGQLGNKDLAQWFAEPDSKEYWFHVRIVGSILELHAEHLATEQRYVARARRMEEAAPELLRMIRAYPAAEASAASSADAADAADAAGARRETHEPVSVVARAWRQASRAVTRMYYAVAG